MKLPIPLFDLGSVVFAKINPEQKGLVTGYLVRPGNTIIYLVTWSEDMDEKECWPCELTEEKEFGTTE